MLPLAGLLSKLSCVSAQSASRAAHTADAICSHAHKTAHTVKLASKRADVGVLRNVCRLWTRQRHTIVAGVACLMLPNDVVAKGHHNLQDTWCQHWTRSARGSAARQWLWQVAAPAKRLHHLLRGSSQHDAAQNMQDRSVDLTPLPVPQQRCSW